jgi:hypothetical protein
MLHFRSIEKSSYTFADWQDADQEEYCLKMDNEKVACKCQPEDLESIRRWLDELEGSNRKMAFDLLNLVMEGKIKNEAAFALLGSKRD